MNLFGIMMDAAAELRLGVDTATITHYRPEFRMYANDAIFVISDKFRQTRKEPVTLDSDCVFKTTDLDRGCLRIEKVTDSRGNTIQWEQVQRGGTEIRCVSALVAPGDSVDVTYRFMPARLVNDGDVPELPEFAHCLIPHYVAAQHRFSQDGDVAGMGAYQMQVFNQMLAKIAPDHLGDERAYQLHHYNEGLL